MFYNLAASSTMPKLYLPMATLILYSFNIRSLQIYNLSQGQAFFKKDKQAFFRKDNYVCHNQDYNGKYLMFQKKLILNQI